MLLTAMYNLGLLLPILALFSTSLVSAADYNKTFYADHCGGIIPPSEVTTLFLKHNDHTSFENGYFSGGVDLFQSYNSTVFAPPSVNFRTKSLHKTRTDGIFQIQATMSLYGAFQNRSQHYRRFNYHPRTIVEEATFGDLAGFWSESDGVVCLVGNGVFQNATGISRDLSTTVNLIFPRVSNLSTSWINGTVNIFDRVLDQHNFDPISVLAYYAPKTYNFTIIPDAKTSCSAVKIKEKKLEILPDIACRSFYTMFRINYTSNVGCTEGHCRPLGQTLGFTPRFLSLNGINCREDGKTKFYIRLSNSSSHPYNMPMIPERSLVGEGFWDPEGNQFCLLACRVAKGNSPKDTHVGDCDIGLTLWFPAVMKLKERSSIVGRVWSLKNKEDANYFDMASIHSLNDGWNMIHGLHYNYTEVDLVCDSRSNGGHSSTELGDQRYPDPKFLGGVRLFLNMKNTKGKQQWGEANFLSIGDDVYGYDYEKLLAVRSPASLVDSTGSLDAANSSMRNVGLQIGHKWHHFDDDNDFEINELAAEGVYNSATGRICMKGCQYLQHPDGSSLDYDSIDCDILINIQFAPVDKKAEIHLNGTITSKRKKTDPFYFDTVTLSSQQMQRIGAVRSVWRMKVEIIMVLISLTFSCICIAMQIFHVKKQPRVLSSVSITMLLALILGYTVPLVLNSEALAMNSTSGSILLRSGMWISTYEVILRMLSIIALFLSMRLLQLAWAARSSAGDSRNLWVQERHALKWCLPLCAAGALFTWLVSSNWEALVPYSGFVLDGFLLPQIIFNIAQRPTGKVLTPFFYIGIMAVRVLPHLYDIYRARNYTAIDSTDIYGSGEWDYYSTAWDVIIPCEGLLLASLIYLQQRFGSECLVPKRLRMFVYRYEVVSDANI